MKCDVFYQMQALVLSQGRFRVDFSTRNRPWFTIVPLFHLPADKIML